MQRTIRITQTKDISVSTRGRTRNKIRLEIPRGQAVILTQYQADELISALVEAIEHTEGEYLGNHPD